MTFGDALRQAREAQGIALQDVADRTKIRGDYLRALEDGNVALLPERTFARSYLQRYARELSLDPTPLLEEFDRTLPAAPHLGQPRPAPRVAAATPAATRRSPLPLTALLAGVLLLGAGGYATYRVLQPDPAVAAAPDSVTPAAAPDPAAPAPLRTVNLSVSSVPSGARVYLDNRDLGVTPLQSFPVDAREQAELRVEFAGRQPLRETVVLTRGRNLRARLLPAAQGASTLTDLAAQPKPKPATTPSPAPVAGAGGQGAQPAAVPAKPAPASAVSVTFTGAAWTRVTDATGRVLYEGTPPAGTKKGFPTGVTVRTGNAGAVQVSVNGGPVQALGASGQVLSRTF